MALPTHKVASGSEDKIMKNRRLFWQIVDKIEALIDGGVYPVGSRLPPERELAENYEVSRPTVREAIIALEVRERVEVKTGSGVYVTQKNKQPANVKPISAFELTQARALIEGEAAAIAATTITEQELSDLKDTLVRMGSGIDADQADQEFHEIISSATRNNAILVSIENLWSLRKTIPEIVASYSTVCSKSDSDRLTEHTAIYEAIASKDPAKARGAMHQHFNRLINALFDASEAEALEEVKRKTSETRGLYSLDHLAK